MGVTVSHTTLAPVSLASTVIGFISFAFTLATFFNVFWSSLQTIHAAPSEISDYLSNVKQGLLQERRHLRKVRKRMRSARKDHSGSDTGGGGGGGGGWSGGGGGGGGGGGSRRHSRGRGYGKGKHAPQFSRDEQAFRSQGEDESLRVMRTAIRDMIKSFRSIEYPFLKPEFQNTDSAHWSTNTPSEKRPYYMQSPPRYGDEDDSVELGRSNRLGNEYRKCGFRERWLWLRRKQNVLNLGEGLSRIETRVIAHETGRMVMMVADLGRDLEDMRDSIMSLEGRMSRVVGVRRVD